MHLMIDGYITKHLDDRKALEAFVKYIASICNMQILSGPHTVEVTDENYEDGWSSVAVSKQSTIAVHMFSLARYIYIDVFTCGQRPDIEKIVLMARGIFGLYNEQVIALPRGHQHRGQDGR